MARFRYRLQSLLNVKKQMESGAKNELMREAKKLEEEKNKLDHLQQQMTQCQDVIVSTREKGVTVNQLRMHNHYLSAIKQQTKIQEKNVNVAEQHVDICREKLIVVSKEKKVLETLKEKKLEEYRYNELKEEEKRVDEIVSYKYSGNENI